MIRKTGLPAQDLLTADKASAKSPCMKLPDIPVTDSFSRAVRSFSVMDIDRGRWGIRARLLDCDGGNIDSAEEIILRDDGACSDLGYPWAVELDSGEIAVCYYFSGADGVRHIAYSLVRRA